jgi:hypothetical protein
VESTSVFRIAFSFAGGRVNEGLGQRDKPSPACFPKGTAARGAAEGTPILSRHRVDDTKCTAESSRRGAHLKRSTFDSALSARIGFGFLRASEGFQGQPRWRFVVASRKGSVMG